MSKSYNSKYLLALLGGLLVVGHLSAQGKLDSLVALPGFVRTPSLWLEAGNVLQDKNGDSARHYFYKAYTYYTSSKDYLGQVKSASDMGKSLTYSGFYDSAHIYFNNAYRVFDKVDDYDARTSIINNQGIAYFYQAKYEEASRLFEEFLHESTKEGNLTDVARATNNLGLIYKYAGQNEKAYEWFMRSLAIEDSLGNEQGKSRTYNNLATVLAEMNQMEEAERYYSLALALKKKHDDHRGMFSGYVNLGIHLKEMKNYKVALAYYDSAYQIATAINYKKGLLSVLNALTVVHNILGDNKKAIEYSLLAVDVAVETNDKYGMASGYLNLGDSYRLSGDLVNGKKYILIGEQYAQEIKNSNIINESYLMLSELNEQLGNYKEAYSYHRKHKALSDSLLNQTNAKAVAELQTKYDTEKKERQILVQNAQLEQKELTIQRDRYVLAGLAFIIVLIMIVGLLLRNRMKYKQKVALEQANTLAREAQIAAVISSQDRERNRFARDLHDTFGQLISVLSLNINSLKGNKPSLERREEVFDTSAAVLNDMYVELKNICFNLMPQTLIHGGIAPALREFANRINVAGSVVVTTDFFGVEERLTELQEISLYRISQEWTNNILKYSNATQIGIQLTRDDEEITLTIEDNGQGFDADLLMQGKGNGWKNIQSRCNLIKGEVVLDTQPGRNGNTLILNAPLGTQVKLPKVESMMETQLS